MGYDVHFPRTRSRVLGVINSMGDVKCLFERQLLTTVRGRAINRLPLCVCTHCLQVRLSIGADFCFETNEQGQPAREHRLGLQLSCGYTPRPQTSGSPILYVDEIFNV